MRTLPTLVLVSMLLSSLAVFAAPPSDEASLAVKRLVEKKLVAPLAIKEEKRSKFSRAGPMPKERRVRVLEAEAQKDTKGRAFRTFAVDSRWGHGDDEWNGGVILGCVYPDDGAMFVKVGDEYRSAKHLLGKKAKKPPKTVCQPSDDAEAKTAQQKAVPPAPNAPAS